MQNWDYVLRIIHLFLSIHAPESDACSTSAAMHIVLRRERLPDVIGSLLLIIFSLWQVITGRVHNNSAELLQLFIANTLY